MATTPDQTPVSQKAAAADVKPSIASLMASSSSTSSANSSSQDVKPSQKMLYQMTPKSEFPSNSDSNKIKGSAATSQDIYAKKLRKIKHVVKDMIFINGSVCDEVLRTEEKLAKAKEERRFLLRKLLQYQSFNESGSIALKTEIPATVGRSAKATAQEGSSSEHGSKSKAVKRKPNTPSVSPGVSGTNVALVPSLPAAGISSDKKRKQPHTAKDLLDSLQGRPKKSKSGGKKIIPPLMLDSLGRPKIPMMLGDVTLHSIGEIVPDRLVFHCPESIYPAGYCITRVYVSLHKVDTRCLYTCKISDADSGPLFEIASEDNSDIVFKANNPTECHSLLLQAVNKSRGADILPMEGNGLNFFALSHPVIQNLIQSIPGARKCSRYKWIKFEINKSESNENVAVGQNDPTISYDAFMAHIDSFINRRSTLASDLEKSTNLRSLLTKTTGGLALASQ